MISQTAFAAYFAIELCDEEPDVLHMVPENHEDADDYSIPVAHIYGDLGFDTASEAEQVRCVRPFARSVDFF